MLLLLLLMLLPLLLLRERVTGVEELGGLCWSAEVTHVLYFRERAGGVFVCFVAVGDWARRVCIASASGGNIGDRVRSRCALELPRSRCPAGISEITSVVAVFWNRRGRAVRRRCRRSRP